MSNQEPQTKSDRAPKVAMTEEVFDEVLEWISDGQLLSAWCDADKEGRPCRQSIHRFKDKDDERKRRFARARAIGFDVRAERTLSDLKQPLEKDDRGRVDPGEVQHRKNVAHHELQLLSRWDHRYRDRVAVGGDSEAPPIVLDETQRRAKLLSILSGAAARAGVSIGTNGKATPVAIGGGEDVGESEIRADHTGNGTVDPPANGESAGPGEGVAGDHGGAV